MINFRFHLISLIAVFLALALGVVMGYGVLGQPTVDTLQDRIDTVEERANQIKAESDDLRAENSRLAGAMEAVGQFAVTSRLEATTVVPVGVRGVDDEQLADAVRLARQAGATVPGIVWVEEKWGVANEEDAAELAPIVGTQSTTRTAVREAAAKALATRLASGPVVGGRTDLLTELDDAGFVSIESIDDEPIEAATLDGRNALHLLVGGTNAVLQPSRGTVPLARALQGLGLPVVVADEWQRVEGGPERGAGLVDILGDEQLRSTVSTVDNLDRPDGPLTVVLVLGDRGQDVIGHYGSGASAERAMPEWWIV